MVATAISKMRMVNNGKLRIKTSMRHEKIALALLAFGLMTAFWRFIVMPYQQGADLKGCIDNYLLRGGIITMERVEVATGICGPRAKFPTWH